jgi:hypothetical protein
MAADRRSASLIAFGGVTAVVVGGAWWLIHSGALTGGTEAKPAAAPALPASALQYAGANVTQAHYLAAGDLKRSGKLSEATVLVVGKSADAIAHKYAFVAKRETVDCEAHTISGELAGEYDAKGTLKNTEYLTGAVGRTIESSDFEAGLVCDGKVAPGWRAVGDWKAAQRAMQTPPDDLLATAQANPKDAAAWAWLCHGAPWHWRPQSFNDCDHAVSLQPHAAAVRVDRGFIALSTGHNAQAMADFGHVLASEADNGAALFGKSLAEALAGDKAAAKRDRDRALGIDPSIPDWIERTFRFQISDPYRGR